MDKTGRALFAMIFVNLTFLGASNGMFWYALDKIRSLDEATDYIVLAPPGLAPLTARQLPKATVRSISRLKALRYILQEKLSGGSRSRVVTFTPHPIPFLGGQTIAFYDDYPFRGPVGLIKRVLFIIGAKTSGSRVGIINRSIAVPFLEKCGIPEQRVFFDSAFPRIDPREFIQRESRPRNPLRIGLVGTDSRKKNYEAIFEITMKLGLEQNARFILYGAKNAYTRELEESFPNIDLVIVPSDEVEMVSFFDEIDYLISASRDEGYGRPMGLAAALGVPMFLLRSPVFVEFFGNHAHFFDDLQTLLTHLTESRPASSTTSQRLSPDLSRSPFFD